MSFCIGLECSKCGTRYSAQEIHNSCDCGGQLLAVYDLAEVARAVTKQDIAARAETMWRYRELMPIEDDSNIVTLQEGYTPIIALDTLAQEIGQSQLFLKDEGRLPGGTFKARGASSGVSKAKELGIEIIAVPTAGNAGGAWSAYGARAKMKVIVVMPYDAPEINKRECISLGAHLFLVKGLISEAGAIVADACRNLGCFSISTFNEPYRLEGKKTLGLEIAEQFGWEFPEVILYPCGGGVGLVGIWKAFKELREMGWVTGNGPRMVAVQSSGCAPVVKAFAQGEDHCEQWSGAQTVADGLRVPKPLADSLILNTIKESRGCAVAVSEEDIAEAMLRLARKEGILACPEGAATVLAVESLKQSG
ncbi:MAG: threonine synthase, partial [Deltaproteobacteria bacterium]|nr:threonine synthase [Deltaproteobacteria bacterium]